MSAVSSTPIVQHEVGMLREADRQELEARKEIRGGRSLDEDMVRSEMRREAAFCCGSND